MVTVFFIIIFRDANDDLRAGRPLSERYPKIIGHNTTQPIVLARLWNVGKIINYSGVGYL